jgi:hypothetical protein
MIILSQPWLLWALPAALTPLLVYWWKRRRRRRKPFPSLKLIRRAAAAESSKLRLREILLTALRILALAAVILAAAGPLIVEDAAGLAPPRRVVLLLDESLSMSAAVDGSTRFDEARTAAALYLRNLPADSRVDLVVFGEGPRLLIDRQAPAAALAALEELGVGVARGDARVALDFAAARLSKAETPAALVLLSDMQGLEAADLPGLPAEATLELYAVGGGENAGAVEELTPRNPLPLVGVELELAAELAGPRREYALYGDGALLDRRTAAGSASFKVVPEAPGPRVYTLRAVEDDAFAPDDVRRLVLEIARPPRTVLLDEPPLVRLALEAAPGLVEVVGQLDDADAACAVLGDGFAARWSTLGPAVEDGLGLLLFVPPAAGLEPLEGLDAALGPPQSAATGLRLAPPADNALSAPLRSALELFTDQPPAERAPTLRLGSDWEVLLSYANDTPALARRERGAGSIVLWALPFRAADGALPVGEAWPPLLLQTLRLAAAGEAAGPAYYGGETLELPAAARLSDPVGRERSTERPVTLDRLGVWSLTVDGRRRPLAVNAHPDESRPSPQLEPAALPQGVELLDAAGLRAGGERPVPLGRWLLLLAVLLLTVELLLGVGPAGRR